MTPVICNNYIMLIFLAGICFILSVNVLLRYIFYIVSMVCWCCSMLSYSGCVSGDCEYFMLLVVLFLRRGGGAAI
jgi:hypothetical protein